MKIKLPSPADTSEFQKNQSYHLEINAKLRSLLHKETALKKTNNSSKLSARERISCLQDPDSFFLELSCLAGMDLYPEVSCAGGGIVTGVVSVAGKLCMVIANEPSVKGGCYFPITVKKHLRAQEIAQKNHLPCLYLVDSGGAYLPRQAELFCDKEGFGKIFYRQAHMSAMAIPQLASIHGHCTAGGAYIPAMSDESIMVKEHGRVFLAGPALVEAATSEKISSFALGGWKVHSQESGVIDDVAENDQQALEKLRQKVSRLQTNHHSFASHFNPTSSPDYSIEDILGLLPRHKTQLFDPRILLACLLDNSQWEEFKPEYGTELVAGWGKLGGIPIGVLANHGILYTQCAQKAAHFIQLCTMQQTPLLFLQNVNGFMVGSEAESSGIAKEGAKMVHAVATANVPKITLITGGSYGAGNYAMCGRAYDGDYLFAWPQSHVAIMGGKQAQSVMNFLAQKKPPDTSSKKNLTENLLQKFSEESSPYYATARLWDDGLIDPINTRKILAAAFASTLQKPKKTSRLGVVRM